MLYLHGLKLQIKATAKHQRVCINTAQVVSSSDSFVCSKCFNSLKRYRILQEQLQMNMKKAIEQSSALTVSHAEPATDACSSGVTEPDLHVGPAEASAQCISKHARLASEPNVARRLQFAAPSLNMSSSSPAVAVRY